MILEIYKDSHGQKGHCRSCHAPIEWAELTSGKRMPFNFPIVVSRTDAPVYRGARVIERVDTLFNKTHFATCPQAQDWRRNK